METRKARSSAKGIVTKKTKEISGLMTDMDESNADEVLKRSAELEQAFKKFQEAHEALHRQLEDPDPISESGNYYQSVLNKVEQLQESVDVWLAGVEASRPGGGGYSIYPWVGRCGAAPHTLTLFKTNIADFPTLFKTEGLQGY